MPRSIRELLTIIAVVSLGCASIRTGGMLAFAFVTSIALLVVALAIIAFVARDNRQVFSIGFLIPITLYGLAHVFIGNQFDPSSNSALATTRMFGPLCSTFSEQIWVDKSGGEVLNGFNPDLTKVHVAVGPGFLYEAEGITGVLTERPTRATIALVAHCILASLIAYLGGRFALFVRRTDAGELTESRRTIACTRSRGGQAFGDGSSTPAAR